MKKYMLKFVYQIRSASHAALAAAAVAFLCSALPANAKGIAAGKVEIAAELPIRPGNVALNDEGRIFATVHPFDGDKPVQLIEITSKKTFRAWPSEDYQSDGKNYSDERLDSPLGIYKDGQNRIWITDMGMHIGKTRIWGFDTRSNTLFKRIDLPADIAPKGSFIQDLVVDDGNGWIYLADAANAGLLAVEISTGKARRFSDHPSLQVEAETNLVADGKTIYRQGKPARIAINPITLSADNETIFFGAMNGRTWYGVPAKLFRQHASDGDIAQAIFKVGAKPVSDGATTDASDNHYFTNLGKRGIDVLTVDGKLQPLVRNKLLDWPDNVRFGPESNLYIAVNQLHKAPAFNEGIDKGQPPYYILKVKVDMPRTVKAKQ